MKGTELVFEFFGIPDARQLFLDMQAFVTVTLA
jgi:hypothetical protein